MSLINKLSYLLLLTCSISCSAQNSDTKQQKEFERYLNRICKKYDIPAMAAAIIRKDKIEKLAAVGIKKLGESALVDNYSKFHIGSCGKSFTGMIAQQLVVQNKMEWTDRPIDIFPDLKNSIHSDFENITFLDLMTHRAGIPAYKYWHEKEKIPNFDGTEIEKRMKTSFWQLKQAAASLQGELSYSNMGYVIAASMMEKKTGKCWEELVEQYVFKPLLIKSFGFGRPALIDNKQPWGHWVKWVNQTPQEAVAPNEYALSSIERPAGDVHLSFYDFAKYVQCHLRGFHGEKTIYDKKFFREIHTIKKEYALGWNITSRKGEECSIHYGSEATFFAVMLVCHQKDLAIAIVANSATPEAKQGVEEVLDKLF